MNSTLDAVSTALSVHPRTILRLTTGEPNPYWAEGYDPEIEIELVAAMVGASAESIDALLKLEDSALTVDEAAKMLRITPAEFYRKELTPDWKVGRVKRYSLLRIGEMAAQ